MPKRTDIHKVLIIGSGPIVIGQACEFDYSGTQGCKALRDEGYEVVLVNSNPATIMTDPEMGDRTYIEPITVPVIERIIERERPDCLLPTLGGQTALNVTKELAESGFLDQYCVELIGAKLPAIQKAEDRELFKRTMEEIGLSVPRSGIARSLPEALKLREIIGLPAIIRPAYTLGGSGAGVAWTAEDYPQVCAWGLAQSPVHEILVEQSVLGWKEFELEVMRDLADNVVIICSIENLDPMGVHTGDSITVAPAQTLTDREYQIMRDAAIRIIRAIGVETGGSNIQFAVHPNTGEMVVIEMNPRVSRSSALASKATGFPIAKIAAKLACGLLLDEIPNDITRKTPASFEPTIDYCVVKIPRWAFEKFPGAQPVLGLQMKSVGETMAIGRTFHEALQKGLRGLEIDRYGLGCDSKDRYTFEQLAQRPLPTEIRNALQETLRVPQPMRIFAIRDALLGGFSVDEIFALSGIDPWFLRCMEEILDGERRLRQSSLSDEDQVLADLLWDAKQLGFSDAQIARLWNTDELTVRQRRQALGVRVVFKSVDTCGAEFEAETPYNYSTYERPYRVTGSSAPIFESEVRPCARPKIVVLGGGPNRIGQGIEFDYCCVHAVMALQEDGFETIMINSNPETVSTDYDTSDRLYFEPLTFEDVMNIIDAERPMGVIVQFGGQTPLRLSGALDRELTRRREEGTLDCRILGTSPDAIDLAEDRKRFARLLSDLDIPQPPNGTATSVEEALAVAERLGYPVLVRPSFVLGGRAMEIVYEPNNLRHYMAGAVEVSFDRPVLVDKFLHDAVEVDVDAVADGEQVYIGGVMEHIEFAGVHSGDSACVLPPRSLSAETIGTIEAYTRQLALALSVRGLMNVQYAVTRDGKVYVLEVNPRASRTVPFVSKATGVPLAKAAARVMAGKCLDELGLVGSARPSHVSVKEAVLPFVKFPGVDTVLGPEMRSTGEVMGIDDEFGLAYARSQLAAGNPLPPLTYAGGSKVFVSVNDLTKQAVLPVARGLVDLGFRLVATAGTQAFLVENGIPAAPVFKVNEGSPNVVDLMKRGVICFVINTPLGSPAQFDERSIRRCAVECGIPYVTTIAAAQAAVEALEAARKRPVLHVKALQDYHPVREVSRSRLPAQTRR